MFQFPTNQQTVNAAASQIKPDQSPVQTRESRSSSDWWKHPGVVQVTGVLQVTGVVQVTVPQPWSSGPKHFTNVFSLLLNCLEPLDQRGSAESVRIQSDALTQVLGLLYLNLRNEGLTSLTGWRGGYLLGQVTTHLSSAHVAQLTCSTCSHNHLSELHQTWLMKAWFHRVQAELDLICYQSLSNHWLLIISKNLGTGKLLTLINSFLFFELF